VPRNILEAANLVILGGQIKERVRYQEDQIERAINRNVRKAANRHRDGVTAWLLVELRDHPLRGVDSMGRQASSDERYRHPPCTDREFEDRPARGEIG
jgi:hypothetical protein